MSEDSSELRATDLPHLGTFATMPKKVNHFVWTKGETVIQVHGIGPYTVNYVNPKR